MTLENFKSRFRFQPESAGLIGIEREVFIMNKEGNPVPESAKVLRGITAAHSLISVGPELSACQVEYRVGPLPLSMIKEALMHGIRIIDSALRSRTLSPSFREVMPRTMPLDVYPDPTGRYQTIAARMPRDVLSAACRIIGTHVHIGMPNHETALYVYNHVLAHRGRLWNIGDHSHGERRRLYAVVASRKEAPVFLTWEDFYEHACRFGYESDPRSNWSDVRISQHGTIEFRMFGATQSIDEVFEWARTCHELCMNH